MFILVQLEKYNEFFEKNWDMVHEIKPNGTKDLNTKEQIQRHFTKADYVALDLRHLNTQNQQIVMNYMTGNEFVGLSRTYTT